ncbi:helix-turn-helix and ligand-binding sensor domain-containing protein [Polaribacter cellanae]|uniref:LuxR family transcriptional regulator n=1 Tax=Polaribacter cellanae TaxID=2818493 RepID=A0A975CNI1_9FLAO|nr:triple tyrosine motif-containing protein [Polaribacter cellanae]QTE22465.1 LuxR family transcriptional regulator [Polaribacter cellanae]
MIRFKNIFLFFFFLSTIQVFQAQEIPPIHNFTTEDYGAENQNWSISQAENKYIYVANNKGLLEYNGENWQLYPTPNETILRSVKCIGDKVFTGFYRDFGYWQKNEFGILEFTSIVDAKKIEMLEDEQIWEIVELDGWVLFKSLQKIYIYNLKTGILKIIEADNLIAKIVSLNGFIYFQELGKGLFKIENGEPELISSATVLKENRITEIFLKEEKLFFITQKKGFYFLENSQLKKWTISADKFLEVNTIYSAKLLRDNKMVLGSVSNGIIYLNEKGEIESQINQNLGLANNTVLSIFEDIDSNIWLGLDNGINFLNFKSPFKLFVNKDLFLGTIYTSTLFKGNLYLGTNQGLFYKKYNSNDNFQFVKNTQGQVWSLKIIDNQLFCGHDSGTFLIKENKAELIVNIQGSWDVKKLDDTTLIQGNYDGLYVLKRENNKWSLKNKIDGFENSARYFLLLDNNRIFVNHEYKGVFKLKINKNYSSVLENIKEGTLQKGIHSSLIKHKNEILYASKKGVYKYLKTSNNFVLDTLYSKLIPEKDFITAKLISDPATNKLWSFTKKGLRFLNPGQFSNNPSLDLIPLRNTLFKGASGFENILHLEKKKYLVGATNGYVTLDLSLFTVPKSFTVDITKIYNYELDQPSKNVSLTEKVDFKNEENSIEFFYSVPNFTKSSNILYQHKLEGYNSKWSDFSQSNFVFFENLPFGDYTFKVRASVGGELSENIAEFQFKIEKPWYLSTLLIVIYVILFLLIIYAWHRASKKHYIKQQEKLLDKAQKELELKELESSQKIIKLNNEKLRNDIESKSRELATSTMSIIKKNEFLNTIKKELLEGKMQSIDKVVKIIDKNMTNTDDWKMFQEAFNNADKKFLKKMKAKHPELTPNDLRLCAYLRLNLSSKEIAPLLNISPRSVEVKRYRLRKKMNLGHDENLTNYILEI